MRQPPSDPRLPPELDPFAALPAGEMHARVFTTTRRYGKTVTVVEGLDERQIDVRALATRLKALVAAGGTYKDGRIELQGDHRDRVKNELEGRGILVDPG